MKIIAGSLGGRRFASPRGNRTHPMSDKVRGAIFNSLGDIKGATVLDAFAGSGALGFEAVSRGAASATLIDSDRRAYGCMLENAAALGITQVCKITMANVSSWSDNNPDLTFSIVLFDPPFDKPQLPLLTKLTRHVAKDGWIVATLPGSAEPLSLPGFAVSHQKSYGDIQVVFYRAAS